MGMEQPWYKSRVVWALVAVLAVCGYVADRSDTPDAPADRTARVVYKVEGTARTASVTYVDSRGNVQQQTRVDVPIRAKADHSEGLVVTVPHGATVSISAQNNGPTGDLICRIEADGRTLTTGRAFGPYSTATCSAEVP